MTDKVIRDGKVAVCISPGFGAGWSTWADKDQQEVALYHPDIVAWIEGGKEGNIDELMQRLIGNVNFYTGGADNLEVEWLPVGTRFLVKEYDGDESILILENLENIA